MYQYIYILLMLRRFLLAFAFVIASANFIGCRPQSNGETDLVMRIESARPAVVQLLTEGSSCSAFHVGHELFITASHCIKPDTEYVIVDHEDEVYGVKPVFIDRDTDVTVFESSGFAGHTLQLWNERLYGFPKIGSALVSLGYPGYYLRNFAFEEGTLLDKRVDAGVKMLVSRGISYPGESGGPVISLHNGQVVGLVHAIAERVTPLGDDLQVHNTLSLLIAWPELSLALEKARKVR
jgi:hypothetical protein